MRELLAILCGIALIAAIEGCRQLYRFYEERRQEELRRRLRSLHDEDLLGASTLLRRGKLANSPALHDFLKKIPLAVRMEKLLEQSDARFTVAQILAWSAIAACGGVVASGLFQLGVVLGAILTLLAAALPTILLFVERDRRSAKLSEQLPEALDMMARSLRAGHALTSSFEVVAGEMPEPVAVEFGRAFESQRLGMSVDQAIVQMTERAPANRDLKIFAVSVLIQRETGGNLAEILGNISETIRSRYRFFGKVRALTAEGRASAVVLGALPFLVALLLKVVNPEFMVPLFTKPLGHAILAGAACLWGVGLLWLYRLTQVDL